MRNACVGVFVDLVDVTLINMYEHVVSLNAKNNMSIHVYKCRCVTLRSTLSGRVVQVHRGASNNDG